MVDSVSHLRIYTEADFLHHDLVGHPNRPVHNLLILVREGGMRLRHNLIASDLAPCSVFRVRSNSLCELERVDSQLQTMVVQIKSEFESLDAIKIRRFDARSFFTTSLQNHYPLTRDEFTPIWDVFSVLNRQLQMESMGSFDREVVHHLFLSAIYLLAQTTSRYSELSLAQLTSSDKLTFGFLKLVGQHFRVQRSIAFYAGQLNISAKHLSETVKERTGYTAGEIIDQALLSESKILLSDPSQTINQVARELSFSDQYAFSKFFKRLTQQSPSLFRERL